MSLKPGSNVLVRAVVGADGYSLLVAPGATIHAESADVIADIPNAIPAGRRSALVMFFRSDDERQKFADDFSARAA